MCAESSGALRDEKSPQMLGDFSEIQGSTLEGEFPDSCTPVMSRRVSEEAEMLERFTEEAGSQRLHL